MSTLDIQRILNNKYLAYALAATGTLLLYSLIPSYQPPRHKVLKGLSHTHHHVKDEHTRELTRKAKEAFPEYFHGEGHHVHLPMGDVKYWLLGKEHGRRVVLVHGLSTPSLIFRPVAEILANHGYRVLLYDLYGRGYSDAPEVPYTAELYITQLALLMQKVGWEKASIVGLSMGGAITAAFAATFPHLVDGRVAFIASAGAMKKEAWRKLKHFWQRRLVASHFKRRLGGGDALDKIVPLQAELLPGYVPAIVSSIIEGPLTGQEEAFKIIGKSKLRVQLIWGTEDVVVPPNYADVLHSLMPHARKEMIKDAGHDLTLTVPDKVAKVLLDFFDEKPVA